MKNFSAGFVDQCTNSANTRAIPNFCSITPILGPLLPIFKSPSDDINKSNIPTSKFINSYSCKYTKDYKLVKINR